MTHNDIFCHICHTFDFTGSKIMAVFDQADHPVTLEQIKAWQKNDDDRGHEKLTDTQMALFLNGLINDRRGKKPGPQPEPETCLTLNIIFKKLKIALDLKADDILEMMARADFPMGKHELSALFRKPGHKHYRTCSDQVLLNFLNSVRLKYRAGT